MNWISVKDKLPEIPKGKYGIQVLIAEFDDIFEEINPGYGYSVTAATYGSTKDRNGKPVSEWYTHEAAPEFDFMQLYYGEKSYEWGPTSDVVTHWMYLPAPPSKIKKSCEGCEAIGYCQ